MLVDVHTHLGDWDDQEALEHFQTHNEIPERLASSYLKAMEPVDRAIVLALYGPPSINSNECVARFVGDHPQKLIGFGTVDPTSPAVVTEVEYAIRELGLKGIKLGPIYQDFRPDDPRHFPMYERIQELQVPIMWHQSTSFAARFGPLEAASPVLLDKVARTFPDLKMIIAHFGYPWSMEVVSLLGKHPNMYTDISALGNRAWFLYNALVGATEYGVAGKVLFGSDYSFFSPSQMLSVLEEVRRIPENTNLPRVPESVMTGIVNQDVLGMLQIG
jgi:predicted TIM-barrel fold metal-dependent hydrolase